MSKSGNEKSRYGHKTLVFLRSESEVELILITHLVYIAWKRGRELKRELAKRKVKALLPSGLI